MRKIKNPHLAQLQMQLRFTSPQKRGEFLKAAEGLVEIIEPDREYPFDFVCYKITGYHPKGLPEETIKGSELLDDLSLFLWKLSGLVEDRVCDSDEKIYTIEQAAKKLNVSTKTISRWRRRGLPARKYTFDDGKKRLGVAQSGLDKFIAANRELAGRATEFSRLNKKQRELIIRLAKQFGKQGVTRRKAISKIAARIERGDETVRAIIEKYEKSGRHKKLFKKYIRPVDSSEAARIYSLYKNNVHAKQLARRFGRSVSGVYRIIRRQRANELLSMKIEFIPSDEFFSADADEAILGRCVTRLSPPKLRIGRRELTAGSLNKYIQSLKDIPALTRDREVELFRQYNYLKFRASEERKKINAASASGRRLALIEKCLRRAEAIKNTIIEANLSLVVSIAGKHTTTGAALQELVSEGNFSLMRAVEHFDYTRGFRFATYASWIIARDFARKFPSGSRRPSETDSSYLDNIQRDLRLTEGLDFGAIERARHSLVQVIKNELDERQEYVIMHRYALTGSPVNKKTKTLREIGEDLNLTRERVRQLELTALQKLKQSLSIEEFELLTG